MRWPSAVAGSPGSATHAVSPSATAVSVVSLGKAPSRGSVTAAGIQPRRQLWSESRGDGRSTRTTRATSRPGPTGVARSHAVRAAVASAWATSPSECGP